jgi:hypothetical protein
MELSPMTFYMTAGPLLFLVVIGVIIYFKPKNFSKKPAVELPFHTDSQH